MVRLEKRAYSRDEISAITGVPRVTANGATNKHFRDTVETRLTNWHYEYIVQHGGDFIITQTPTTALDRLHEIMMRELRFDKQVSPRDFAAFLHFMMTVPDADCMPMEERLDYINGVYQPVCLSKSTLERWTAGMEDAEALGCAGHAQVRWKTEKINGLPYRTKVEGAEMLEERNAYTTRMHELYSEKRMAGFSGKALNRAVFGQLWQEFGFGYTKPIPILTWNGFTMTPELYSEILDLVTEICEGELTND